MKFYSSFILYLLRKESFVGGLLENGMGFT